MNFWNAIVNNSINSAIVRCIDSHICFMKNNKPKFLILKRSENKRYPSIWQCVTGKIKPNEKPTNAALREIFEETGLVPKKVWSLDFMNYYFDSSNNTTNMIPVFGAVVQSEEVTLSDEHISFKWVDIEEGKDKLLWNNQIKGMIEFQNLLSSGNSVKRSFLEIDLDLL